MIKKILVAIDGSKSSDNALDFALDLADKYSAQIMLISVFNPPTVSYLTSPAMVYIPVDTTKHSDEIRVYHDKMLSEALKKVKNFNKDLKVTKKLLEGRPADKIVETAKDGRFDLIVIGSRGLGGIKEFLLGSVSDRVADEAPCPVLIIKDKMQ
jgi:nucleotide-binding universal stress UspA family protein